MLARTREKVAKGCSVMQPDHIARGLWWDRAWSIVEGCAPVSEGCRNCWSAAQTSMRAHQKNEKMMERYDGLTNSRGRFNGTVRPMDFSLELPLRVRKPTTWAIWNDLFHADVPDEFIAAALGVIAACPRHTFVALTKRAGRLPAWFRWYEGKSGAGASAHAALFQAAAMTKQVTLLSVDELADAAGWPLKNLILGVTAEDQYQADSRIPPLLDTPAVNRVVSYEPALGPIDFGPWLGAECHHENATVEYDTNATICRECEESEFLDWVIAGAESGSEARETDLDWLRNVRDTCGYGYVPFFLKQARIDGKIEKLPELDGKRWAEFPRTVTTAK